MNAVLIVVMLLVIFSNGGGGFFTHQQYGSAGVVSVAGLMLGALLLVWLLGGLVR